MEMNAFKTLNVRLTGADKEYAMEINRMVKLVNSILIAKALFALKMFAES